MRPKAEQIQFAEWFFYQLRDECSKAKQAWLLARRDAKNIRRFMEDSDSLPLNHCPLTYKPCRHCGRCSEVFEKPGYCPLAGGECTHCGYCEGAFEADPKQHAAKALDNQKES